MTEAPEGNVKAPTFSLFHTILSPPDPDYIQLVTTDNVDDIRLFSAQRTINDPGVTTGIHKELNLSKLHTRPFGYTSSGAMKTGIHVIHPALSIVKKEQVSRWRTPKLHCFTIDFHLGSWPSVIGDRRARL